MPRHTELVLPLRVAPTALTVTMPELLNLSVDARLTTGRPVQRVSQGFLASARIGADGGPRRSGM